MSDVTDKMKASGQKAIRIGVADKSPLVHAALTHLFASDDRFNLTTICADGESFLRELELKDLDVAVSGWIIGPGQGQFILDQIRARDKKLPIVIYSGAEGDTVAAQAMAHGAAAFVSKSEQPEVLLDTIAAVASGRMVFPFLDVRKIHQSPLLSLTKREMEVLSALAAGHSNKEIAASQGITLNTVKFHIRNLFEKLAVNNRAQAIAIYLKS